MRQSPSRLQHCIHQIGITILQHPDNNIFNINIIQTAKINIFNIKFRPISISSQNLDWYRLSDCSHICILTTPLVNHINEYSRWFPTVFIPLSCDVSVRGWINDVLFVKSRDEPLSQHRVNNSVPVLFVKVLVSTLRGILGIL